MKTAEEMINDFSLSHPHVRAKDVVALLMREYAKEVAQQALNDAYSNSQLEYFSGGDVIIDKDSIVNTPIITP